MKQTKRRARNEIDRIKKINSDMRTILEHMRVFSQLLEEYSPEKKAKRPLLRLVRIEKHS